jgi:alkylation response protein AidB-like acyl-CoA dehydrogenase
MDFVLSPEQEMLAATVNRLLGKSSLSDLRRAGDVGHSEDRWRELAGLGLLGLQIPERYGGIGGSAAETMIVMEAFGRHLAPEPFLTTAIVGAGLIVDAADEPVKEQLLPKVAAGDLKLALANSEPDSWYDNWSVRTTATLSSDSYVIEGDKVVVIDGASADLLIVSARTSGGPCEPEGISLFLVDPRSSGVSMQRRVDLDARRSANIKLRGVRVPTRARIAPQGEGLGFLERAIDRGRAALCSEAVGCMNRLVELSIEHLQSRKQFGQPLARFQILQHRVADMVIALEQCRAIALYAAAKCDEPHDRERRQAASAAKAMTGLFARRVGEQSIQLHGGMGMTDELAVGHYFKRLTCIDMTWGNAEHHFEAYAEHV